MQNLTQPTLLLKPFAESGDKNSIPDVNSDPVNPQLASLTSGFPQITSLSPDDGGLPPERKDFNGLGYLTTTYDFFYQAGGTFTYNPTIAMAIGGYPAGARLWYTDSTGTSCILRSTIDDNTNNFLTDPSVIGEPDSDKPWVVETFSGINNGFKLLTFQWTDHLLNDASWVRADTFSWQDGTVYHSAYNHLVDDIDGKTTTTETIGGITITYYLADDGHKIVPSGYEQSVADIFNATGVSWYYILDTANQRFKLPRTKWGFTGLRDAVGRYVPHGLPGITGYVGAVQTDWNGASASGALFISASAAGYNATSPYGQKSNIGFDASRSSPVYGNSTTVQPHSTQMYLYFYVGQFTQTATQQTAGLNSELFNEKVDLDSSWGFPSSSYDNLTLGASGARYTAPGNGWFVLSKIASSSQQGIEIINESAGDLSLTEISSGSSQDLKVFMPAKKGDSIAIGYNTGGSTNFFRFIYAKKTNEEAICLKH